MSSLLLSPFFTLDVRFVASSSYSSSGKEEEAAAVEVPCGTYDDDGDGVWERTERTHTAAGDSAV